MFSECRGECACSALSLSLLLQLPGCHGYSVGWGQDLTGSDCKCRLGFMGMGDVFSVATATEESVPSLFTVSLCLHSNIYTISSFVPPACQ